MRKEECSSCGKEYDIRELYESLDSDEYTCKKCIRKMEDEGEMDEEPEIYADISEVPRGGNTPNHEEMLEGDDWDQRDQQESNYGDSY